MSEVDLSVSRDTQAAPVINVITPLERETIRRVIWRIMPLLMAGYFTNYIDRVNVGIAGLTMNKDIGLSSTAFGFGFGLFFIGYFLFEIPSNLIMARIGARRWIARILFSWGIVSALTAFVWNDWSFFGIRFLLGTAEAGFYPGMLLFITWWFPSYYRSRMVAVFQSAMPISLILGQPLSAWLLSLDGSFGLHGWQLLFLIEALPALIMGVVFWKLVTDHPRDAAWLRPEQREWLQGRLDSETAQREAVRRYSLFDALSNPRIWLLAMVYFGYTSANNVINLFLPQIVRSLGVSIQATGFVAALPFVFGLAAMLYWSGRSDRSGSRTMYAVTAAVMMAIGLAAGSFTGTNHPVLMMAALTVGIVGIQSFAATFWPLPTAILSGVAAAGGLAMINSVGNLGGFVAPTVYGMIKDATGGSDQLALLVVAAMPVVSAVVLLVLGHDRRLERIPRT